MNIRLAQTLRRRDFLTVGVAVAAAPFFNRNRYHLFAQQQARYSRRAIDLVLSTTVIDMTCALSLSGSTHGRYMRNPDDFTAAELQRFRDSGISVLHTGFGGDGGDQYGNMLREFGLLNGFLAHHHANLMRIDSLAALEGVKASGKIGILPGRQNAAHFRVVDDVDFFHSLGQRVSQLTYNSRNLIGNGFTERRDDGISDFGVAVINRMNKVGMAIDVSHCGDRTTLDAFELSVRPVLITHANCRALADHPRCKTDEAIRKMAARGGVMGITGVRNFVKTTEPTTLEDMLDHYDHVRRLVGVQHVGLGSDIDLDGNDDLTPQQQQSLRNLSPIYAFRAKFDIEGVDHPKRVFDLTEGLIRRGYSDADIRLVLGDNFRRALKETWTV